jgi:hypothetical protein
MTRASSGLIDTVPVDATEVTSIGYTEDANAWAVTTDYTFDAATNKITWITGHGPTAGQSYSVTVKYTPGDDQYTPQLLTSVKDVIDFYGPDLKTAEGLGTDISPISTAAQAALKQGVPAIWVLQVKPAGASIAASDYQAALDTHIKFIGSLWRIVPADAVTGVNAVIDGHVNAMSLPDERMERTVVYGAEYSGAPTTFAEVQTKVGSYAAAKGNKRINVVYPDAATAVFSDGKVRDVGAPIIAAAYAGAEAVLPSQRSRTRMNITGFVQLKGVKMTRVQMNLLAEQGVLILTQASPNADVIVRHQLTTDMSNIQTRETSITDIGDTVSKILRQSVEQYIGKYNLTPDVVTRIDGTLKNTLGALKNAGVIVEGKVNALMQDTANPDTLIVSISVLPPYPCNYIDISLILD